VAARNTRSCPSPRQLLAGTHISTGALIADRLGRWNLTARGMALLAAEGALPPGYPTAPNRAY
jgi:hypothetical protein